MNPLFSGMCSQTFRVAPPGRSLVAMLVASLALAATGLFANAEADRLPPALRGVDPDRLSGGLYAALVAAGAYGPVPEAAIADAQRYELQNKGAARALLDPRVGPNLRLGGDPEELPTGSRHQAEAHVFRSAANPQLLLATFQEGRRYAGAADTCGYSISLDGGFTWNRALLPGLAQVNGGVYERASDPVAAIDLQGRLFVNTLALGASAAVVVTRSTNGGASWSQPLVAYQPPNDRLFPDKNWIAVNDYAGSARAGRLVVSFTGFSRDANGRDISSNIYTTVSDNQGDTWSRAIEATAFGQSNQGSLPVFLPDGALAMIYITSLSAARFNIDCKLSTDGGSSWPSAVSTIETVEVWDDPEVREGSHLPSFTVARSSGELMVTWQGLAGGQPRVFFAKSSDRGASWSPPAVVSDNPPGVSVMNPIVAATPDGQRVTIIFNDKRHAVDGRNFVDIYAAQSFDGGATWQPGIRVTDASSDIRLAQSSPRGFMLGDYMGLAPSWGEDQPAVAVWVETRAGNADPFAAAIVPRADPGYATWGIAQFTAAERATEMGAAEADPDADGYANELEYAHGTSPHEKESGSAYDFARGDGYAIVAQPTAPGRDLAGFDWQTSDDGLTWRRAQIAPAVDTAPGAVPLMARTDGPSLFRQRGPTGAIAPEILVSGSDARLVNISSRAQIKGGESQAIVGFVVSGGEQDVMIRGVGPTLTQVVVTNPVVNPRIELVRREADQTLFTVGSNDDWASDAESRTRFARLGAFGLGDGSRDAALVVRLPARAYTALITGEGNAGGIGLVEAYDAESAPGAPSGPRLINLSTRAEAGAGDDLLIGGFVITGRLWKRVLIRAVGPTLATQGVSAALRDATVALYRNSEAGALAENDDWSRARNSQAAIGAAARAGAFALPVASLDAALVLSLAPGRYTAHVRGAGSTTGIALVEVYDLD